MRRAKRSTPPTAAHARPVRKRATGKPASGAAKKKRRVSKPPDPPTAKAHPPTAPIADSSAYHRKRLDTGATERRRSAAGREISGVPPEGIIPWEDFAPSAEELAEREACRADLRRFLEHYFPAAFPLEWSPDHLRIITTIQTVILSGGCFALAMPRGSGKTTIIERAALWALVYAHRRYVSIIGAKEEAGNEIIKSIKEELEDNQILRRPFREVTYPVYRMEGETRRANGQTWKGERTKIGWKPKEMVLPTMPGSACSGSRVSVCGLTGNVRGQKKRLKTGEVLRPDLVFLDDPQTRESAHSPLQTETRLATVRGDVMGLAGPNVPLAALAAVTVIAENDLADQLLDRERNPDWRGERIAAVRSWPTAEKLWDQYIDLRRQGLRADRGTEDADAFYLANRAAMDKGADISWKARHPGCISAVQWVINERERLGEAAFFAEYMNAPPRLESLGIELMTPAAIAAKLNHYPRGIIPAEASHLTCFVDVGDRVLHWGVFAWASNFTGWLVSYGLFPEQRLTPARKAPKTLSAAYPGAGKKAAIRQGLLDLTGQLLGTEYKREDGGVMKIERGLIDRGYEPDPIFDAVRASPHASILHPCLGEFIGKGRVPMERWPKKPGERHGWHFVVRPPARGRAIRVVVSDVNHFKTLIHEGLRTPIGDPGAISLYGKDQREHTFLAQHLTAETCEQVPAKTGEILDQWTPIPARENHFFDVVVGNAAAAAMCGCVLPGAPAAVQRVKVVDLSRFAPTPMGGR